MKQGLVVIRRRTISFEEYERKRRELEALVRAREPSVPDLLRIIPVETVAYWVKSSASPTQIVDALLQMEGGRSA